MGRENRGGEVEVVATQGKLVPYPFPPGSRLRCLRDRYRRHPGRQPSERGRPGKSPNPAQESSTIQSRGLGSDVAGPRVDH